MRPFRPIYMTGLALLLVALASEARAGQIEFSYSTTIVSNTVTVTGSNGGSGTVSPTAIGTPQDGFANPLGSTQAASNPIGGYNITYSGGGLPAQIAVTGVVTYDVKVTDMTSGQSGDFIVTATFNNLFTQGNVPITPALGGAGNLLVIGNTFYALNALSIGTNINVPGTTINVGFEYAAVPEPTSMALLGIGMTSFLAFRRFFKRTPLA
jgi:hypothetical protein